MKTLLYVNQVSPGEPTGQGSFERGLIDALCLRVAEKLETTMVLFTLTQPGSAQAREYPGVKAIRMPLNKSSYMSYLLFQVRLFIALCRELWRLRKEEVAIYTRYNYSMASPGLAAFLFRRRLTLRTGPILSSQNDGRSYNVLVALLIRVLFSFHCHVAQTIIVVTKSIGVYVTEQFPASRGKIQLIGNGVNVNMFRPMAPKRKNWGLPETAFVVGYVGALYEAQGVATILRALAVLKDQGCELPYFLIVGDGPCGSELRKLATQLCVDSTVIFSGRRVQEDVPEAIACAGCQHQVATRRSLRSFGSSAMKLFEYMACARPILASAAPDHQLNLSDLSNGRYEKTYLDEHFPKSAKSPDFASNILNRLGLLYQPFADHLSLLGGAKKPSWPNGAPFAVCLTHDMDGVSRLDLRHYLRRTVNTIRYGSRSRDYRTTAKHLLGYATQAACLPSRLAVSDPLHTYERWLDMEAAVGAKSTFFCCPERSRHPHFSDTGYHYEDRVVFNGTRCTVADMMKTITREGCEVGLHPFWFASVDLMDLTSQKAQLERAIGTEVVSVRQHYLQFNMRITPRLHHEAGFRFDSTLGFNQNVGFRFGTSYPWHLFDLERQVELNVLEIPLIIQDVSLIRNMRLSCDDAMPYIRQLADTVARVGGVLTLLWHTDVIDDERYVDLYTRTLAYLKKQNAFFGSVREIGSRWKGWLRSKERDTGGGAECSTDPDDRELLRQASGLGVERAISEQAE